MVRISQDTDALLRRAGEGDDSARQILLERYRSRLRRMIAVRMDRRLSGRVDPSDVIQEALVEAHQGLNGYLKSQPVPFYPWLRQIAWERLLALHRLHIHAQRRSVTRETLLNPPLPDESVAALAERLIASATSPSRRLIRDELRERARGALGRLPSHDREVLVLRHLEGLSIAEIAAVLGIEEGAVKMRQSRALVRLRALLDEEPEKGR